MQESKAIRDVPQSAVVYREQLLDVAVFLENVAELTSIKTASATHLPLADSNRLNEEWQPRDDERIIREQTGRLARGQDQV